MNKNRRKFLTQLGLGISGFTLFPMFSGLAAKPESSQYNVLFLPIDDLRPQLDCYGREQMITPNIDRLALNGVQFNRAYCQEPVCMPSRSSLLSGYRPSHEGLFRGYSVKETIPGALTLTKHFEQNGYSLWGTGKVYHHGEDHREQFGEQYVEPDGEWVGRGYLSDLGVTISKTYGRGPAFEHPDVPDNAYPDGARTDLAIEQLKHFQNQEQPFLMAVGYKKPHLPFNAPNKYWDMYENGRVRLPLNSELQENATDFTYTNFGELRNYYGIPGDREAVPDDMARKLIHGYYACVSYIDAQVGRLLDTLEELDMSDNTIIVLWGDHGWKLGEHGMWCKHTPYEYDARAPLIFSVPGMKYAGRKTDELVEFVDIYPTLSDLCGLDMPEHLQGDSLVPLLRDPFIPWKEGAFTQWPKSRRDEEGVTGYSVKTDRYRLIEWTRRSDGKVMATELYDHDRDPGESVNIADFEENAEVVSRLSKLLDGGQGWRKLRR